MIYNLEEIKEQTLLKRIQMKLTSALILQLQKDQVE
jgi:hypothetical protein